MAISVQARGDRHQLRVTHRLLPRAFFFTFDTQVEARTYGEQLVALLARGVVPAELAAAVPTVATSPLVIEVIRAYSLEAPLTDSDAELLGTLLADVAGLRTSGITYRWADAYVRRLKLERNLAPGSIRKRIGALARAIDWHLRRSTADGAQQPANALRLLPRGYSAYSRTEAAEAVAAGKLAKRDQVRDLRLGRDGEARVRAVLAGAKRDDRERAFPVDPAFTLLFALIVDTGLRLREAYRLRVGQVDQLKGVLHVEGTKGHRGVLKPRTVPLKPALAAVLASHCRGRIGLVFPTLWDGDPSPIALRRTTGRLVSRFGNLFDYAGLPELTEHDLRHEATIRWVEVRNSRGGWAFSEIEVCRIMGWSDTKMMLRYASLRGEDLAARLL